MGCGFGAQRKGDGRFSILLREYPKCYDMVMNYTNNGVTFREALRKALAVNGLYLPDEGPKTYFLKYESPRRNQSNHRQISEMKIETTKSMLLSAEILEVLVGGEVMKGLVSTAQKWAEELTKDSCGSAFIMRKYITDEKIEFTVTVSIGTPNEEEES